MTQRSLLDCFDDLSGADLSEHNIMGSEETSAPVEPTLDSKEQILSTVTCSAPLGNFEEEDITETQTFRGQQQSGREKPSGHQTKSKTQSVTDSKHRTSTKEGESTENRLEMESGTQKQLSGTGTISAASSLAQYLVKTSKSNEEDDHETRNNTRTAKSVDGGSSDTQGTEAVELEEDGSDGWFEHYGDHDLDDFGNFQDEDYG